MTIFQETLTVSYDVDLDNFLPGFNDKFGSKIDVFKICSNNDFQISFLEQFNNDKKLRSEIKKFIRSEWVGYTVVFVDGQLPF